MRGASGIYRAAVSSGSASIWKTRSIQPPFNLTFCGLGTWRDIVIPPQDDDFCQPVPLLPVPVASTVTLRCCAWYWWRRLVNTGVGQCSLPKSKPNQLILPTATRVSHLDPTRKKQRVSTSGTDSPIISEHECYTWNRLVSGSECLHLEPTHLKYRLPNHQEASVKHLDPTCRRIDTLTTNWIITEPTQKNSEFRCY